jgi:general secretion pathway protein L
VIDFWCQGWSEIVGASVFDRLRPDEPVCVIHADGSESVVLRGRTCRDGRAASAGVVAVQVPEQMVLQREMVLPPLTARDTEHALAIEVADVCPFPVDSACWGWRVEDDEGGADRARRVRLAIASRAHVEALLDPFGDRLGGIEPEVWVGSGPYIVLRGFGEGPRLARNRGRTRRLWGLGATALLLCSLLLLSPFLAERQRVFSAQAALEALLREAAPVVAQRDGLVASNERLKNMRADHAQSVDLAPLLEILTRLLLDDVVLTQIEAQRNGHVRIAGDAQNASKVMEALERDSMFGEVRSPAPTRRNVKTGKESFVVEFTFHGGALAQ